MLEIFHRTPVRWATAGAVGALAVVGVVAGCNTGPRPEFGSRQEVIVCRPDLTRTSGQWITETPEGVEVEQIADRLELEPSEYRTAIGGTVFGFAETTDCDYPGSSYPSVEEVRTQQPDVDVGIEGFGPCVAYDTINPPGVVREDDFRAPHDLNLVCVMPEPYRATVPPGSS